MDQFQFTPRPSTRGSQWGSHHEPEPADTNLRFTTVPRRFMAWVFDWLVPFLVLWSASELLSDLMVAFVLWNSIWLQGRTGASLGKKAMGLQLAWIPEDMSRSTAWSTVVPGVGRCALRFVAHVLDSICMIGVFKGLWNTYGKTFADSIAHTVVIYEDRPLMSREEYLHRRWGR